MKLCFQNSGKYAGILALPALCKLQVEFTVEYTATIELLKSENAQRTRARKEMLLGSIHNCSVRITVYGVESEKSSVGQLLSAAGLYLQHPSTTELSKSINYWNPHYLLRPGSQMPALEGLSISSKINNATNVDSIDEIHKSRFMQMFNSASGPISNLVNPIPSPRLKSQLKEYVTHCYARNNELIKFSHQFIALAMMAEKECGIMEISQFSSLWEPFRSSGSSVLQLVAIFHRNYCFLCIYSSNCQIDTVIKLQGHARATQNPSMEGYLLT